MQIHLHSMGAFTLPYAHIVTYLNLFTITMFWNNSFQNAKEIAQAILIIAIILHNMSSPGLMVVNRKG